MWWEWLIFVLLLTITPFGVGYFSACVKKKNNLTKEQEKAMNLNMFKYLLFYWLIELFFMSVFIIDSLPCKYIFGGLTLLIVFCNLTMSFLSSKTKDTLQRIGLLQDFIAGVVLTIYLIYIIPGKQIKVNGAVVVDNSLRDIITTIVAAVYGGLLTLVGVAWTIRKGDKDRRKDEIEKFKPVFWILMDDKSLNKKILDFRLDLNRFAEEIQNNSNNCNWVSIRNFYIQNSDKTAFFVYGFLINGKIYEVNNKFVVNKDDIVKFFVHDYHIEQLNNFYIIVEDLIGNLYMCRFRFDNESNHEIRIYGCAELLNFTKGVKAYNE